MIVCGASGSFIIGTVLSWRALAIIGQFSSQFEYNSTKKKTIEEHTKFRTL
jgi:hypothetical protein